MQKKIIALAIAGLASTAAFAQSNVTVYGVVDLGQAWVKGNASGNGITGFDASTPPVAIVARNQNQRTVGRLDSNSSHIGFKGVEDLGNGLKAVFQIESGINMDSAGGNWASRDSFIGLAGGFGTIAAGTLTHPLRAMGVKVDIMPGDAGIGTTNSVTGAIHGIKTGADDRASNAIAYISPSFSGFNVTVAYVNGEQRSRAVDGGNSINAKAWQIAGQYDNGPLYVGLGYHRTNDSVQTGNAAQIALSNVDARVWRLAAVYTAPFGTRFSALYDNTKVDNLVDNGNGGAASIKRSAWSLAAAQDFGANTVGLQYGQSGRSKISDGMGNQDDKAKIWSLLYTYSLSKRTMIHARYSRLTNDNDGNFNFYNNPVSGNGADTGNAAGNFMGATTIGNDNDYSGFMIGLRHSF
jgi:predicted porin